MVIHNPSVPFVVEVGATTIRDLGTEFDVLSEQDSLKVSVRAGSVEIKMLGSEAIALRAGSEFRIDAVAHCATVSSANAEDAFAWQDGRLIYHDTPLIEILADLNRYAETPIRLADPEVGKLRFSGALMIQPSAGLVSQLEAFLPLRSEPGKEEILLRGR